VGKTTLAQPTQNRIFHLRPFLVLLIVPLSTTVGTFAGERLATAIGIMNQPFLAVFSWGNVFGLVGLLGGGFAAWWLLPREWDEQAAAQDDAPARPKEVFWFPGSMWGGLSLIVAPILLLTGVLLRVQYHFYSPNQLEAYAAQPALMTASYSLFAMGLFLLWPGFILLTKLIGTKRPGWAMWGGMLAMAGVFVRLYHEGVNHQAFQLVPVLGLDTATKAITDSYTSWNVFYPLVFADNFGWLVLGIGAYLSRTLGWLPSLLLAMMIAHSSGVLKGTDLNSVVLVTGLCLALVPLGVRVVRREPRLSRSAVRWSVIGAGVMALLFIYTATR
jgi:hypothetical protein